MPSFFDARVFREASQFNGFSGNLIERWSEARDESSLANALSDPRAAIYLFTDDRALIKADGEKLRAQFAMAEADAPTLSRDSLILLGIAPEGPRFAATVPVDVALPESIKAIDLRSLAIQGVLDPRDLAALAQARSYLHWHAVNRFCGRCGGELTMLRGGVARGCAVCDIETFPRLDPVVIMLAIDGENCLLGRQALFAPGMYSALAGFMEPGETIEEAVRREIKEESGISVGRVAYHSSQAWPFPSLLMIGCHAEATTRHVERDATELEDCRWFSREEVRTMFSDAHPQGLKAPFPMAIAHHLITTFAEWKG